MITSKRGFSLQVDLRRELVYAESILGFGRTNPEDFFSPASSDYFEIEVLSDFLSPSSIDLSFETEEISLSLEIVARSFLSKEKGSSTFIALAL